MSKDSIAQIELARLESMLQRAQDHVAQLRGERDALDPTTLEWVWADEALFEARCEVRRIKAALKMAGRVWECERCGERHGPEWVAAYGLRCNAECDGHLREVAHG